MIRQTIWCILGSALIALQPSAKATTLPPPPPQQVVWENPSQTIELDKPTEILNFKFVGKNIGTESTAAVKIDKTCGCTEATINPTIPTAGQQIELTGKIQLRSSAHTQNYGITVTWIDGTRSDLTLTVISKWIPDLITPSVVWGVGETNSKEVEINLPEGNTIADTQILGKHFQITGTRQDGTTTKITIQPLDGTSTGALRVTTTTNQGENATQSYHYTIFRRDENPTTTATIPIPETKPQVSEQDNNSNRAVVIQLLKQTQQRCPAETGLIEAAIKLLEK